VEEEHITVVQVLQEEHPVGLAVEVQELELLELQTLVAEVELVVVVRVVALEVQV
tara:strand:- start:35 stop:199 length:165 start_codon:yes stop_codon:yes gene_type:complete